VKHRPAKTTSGPAEPAGGRSFFLAVRPDRGAPQLEPEDAAHARRVLRLGIGDALVGLDGEGGRWPLRVADVAGGAFEVEAAGQPQREPGPGEPGGRLPWIEVAVCLPREKRAEAMVDRLVQLGMAALTPLWAERSQGPLRPLGEGRVRRLRRIAREACKQADRAWMPVIHPTAAPADLLAERAGCPAALLDPDGPETLLEWAGTLDGTAGTPGRPLLLLIGPEGGLTAAERAELVARGARPVALGPHVLRIETAAEAALAGLVLALGASSWKAGQKRIRSRSET